MFCFAFIPTVITTSVMSQLVASQMQQTQFTCDAYCDDREDKCKAKNVAAVSLHVAYGRDTAHFVCISCQHHCCHVMEQGACMKHDEVYFHAIS